MTPTRTIDGEVYLASGRAAEEFGYSQDYIGQLARGGKIAAEKIGNTWYVSRRDLEFYLELAERSRQEVGGRPRIGGNGEVAHSNEVSASQTVKPQHALGTHGTHTRNAHVAPARVKPLQYEHDNSPLIPNIKKTEQSVATEQTKKHNLERSVPLRTVASEATAAASRASERLAKSVVAPERVVSVAHSIVPFAHTADIIQRALFLSLVTLLLSGSLHAFSTGVTTPTPERIARTWTDFIGSDITNTIDNATLATAHLSLPQQFASTVYERVASTATFFASLFSFDFWRGGDGQDPPPASTALTEAERRAIAERILATSTDGNGDLALITDNEEARAERESARTTSAGSQTVVQQPVIERVIETQRIIERTGLSEEEIEGRLTNLENKLTNRIFDIESQSSTNATSIVNNYTNISRTNKIDDLGDVTIHGSKITDSSFSGSSVSADSGSFGSLSSSGALTVSGALEGAGASFSGTVGIYDTLSVANINATSTTATSTFSGPLAATFAPTKAHTFGSWVTGASGARALDAALVVNPASATADSNLISASVNGSAKFLVDAEGDVFVNNLTSVGETTVSTTTASTFTVEGNTTLGDAITDTTTINGTLTVTGTTTSSVEGNFGVGTTTPAWKLAVEGIGSFDDYVRASYFVATSTAATSTFAGGLAIETSGLVYDYQTNQVGIGTASPDNTLTVSGTTDFTGNVGIGTTTPWKRLSVTETVADAQFSLAYDSTRYVNFQTDSVGDLVIDPQGDDAFFNDGNLWLCAGGACPALTSTSTTGNLFVEESVTFGNGFSVVEKASNELGVYNQNGALIIIFDDGS